MFTAKRRGEAMGWRLAVCMLTISLAACGDSVTDADQDAPPPSAGFFAAARSVEVGTTPPNALRLSRSEATLGPGTAAQRWEVEPTQTWPAYLDVVQSALQLRGFRPVASDDSGVVYSRSIESEGHFVDITLERVSPRTRVRVSYRVIAD